MSAATIDIVQVNIYGVTLADITEKGVNIPFILGTYGFEKCVAFDVPHIIHYPRGMESSQDISTFCSDESFNSVSSEGSEPTLNSTNIKQEEDEVPDSCSIAAPAVPSLFNCSFSTIYSDHADDINDEEIVTPVEVENVQAVDADTLQYHTNASEILEEAPAPYEPTQAVIVGAIEETLPFNTNLPSNQHDISIPLSSALLAAMNCLDDQLNDNDFRSPEQPAGTDIPMISTAEDYQLLNSSAPRYHLIESKPETYVNRFEIGNVNISENALNFRPMFIETQDDCPSSPQNKKICIENQIQSPINSTSNWIAESEADQSVTDNMELFNYDDIGGNDVYEDDDAIAENQPAPPTSIDLMEGVRIKMTRKGGKRKTPASDGQMRILIGKKPVTEETRIVKCNYKKCTTELLLRLGYGRDRLVNHVRTHMKGITPWKCRICDYASTTENNVRTHHRSKHSEIQWESGLKNESPDDLKALLETFKICFPGWDAKFSIDEYNCPGGSHQFKYLGIDDFVKFQGKRRL